MNTFSETFDFTELIIRAIKYIVEGIAVGMCCFLVGSNKKGGGFNIEEIAIVSVTAAAVFSILDTFIPSMAVTARSGAGFGIGANLVGFPAGGMR